MNEIFIYAMIFILISSASFFVSYFFLYHWFKKANTYLVDQHIDDMSLIIKLNNRVKILERRLLNVLKAFRNERKSKKEILNCIHIKVHDCDK